MTPEARISPLGGKPASDAEKEYYNKKKQAEDLALAKNYKDAIPVFDELHAQSPEDVEVMFYLMLSHGSTEDAPSKKSKAYEFAQKILDQGPSSREAEKARSYVNSANLTIPEKFKYGTDTMASRGEWVMTEEAVYKTQAELPLHVEMSARLTPNDQSILWETEASPATASGFETLPKGTEVKVLSVKDFIYGLTSWRKKVEANPSQFDTTMFDVSALYVEVTSEGPLKEKKGWIVNHVDRYLGTEGDGWGVWISNRLGILREADLEEASPSS